MNLYGNLLNGALTIGVYADYINYGNFYYGTAKGYQHAVMTEKAYISFNHKWFGIGAEWVQQTYKNGEYEVVNAKGSGTNDTVDAMQSGISVFAYGNIIQNRLSVFFRYDMYTADKNYNYSYNAATVSAKNPYGANTAYTDLASNLSGSANGNSFKETFISAGIDWSPLKDKKLHIMPNLWMYQIKNAYGSDALASATYSIYRLTFLFAF